MTPPPPPPGLLPAASRFVDYPCSFKKRYNHGSPSEREPWILLYVSYICHTGL